MYLRGRAARSFSGLKVLSDRGRAPFSPGKEAVVHLSPVFLTGIGKRDLSPIPLCVVGLEVLSSDPSGSDAVVVLEMVFSLGSLDFDAVLDCVVDSVAESDLSDSVGSAAVVELESVDSSLSFVFDFSGALAKAIVFALQTRVVNTCRLTGQKKLTCSRC